MKFGVFIHANPTTEPAGKHFSAGPDGTLHKRTVGSLTRSQYATCDIEGLAGLAEWLETGAAASQHLTQGVSEHPKALVVSVKDRASYNGKCPETHLPVITRTNDDLVLSNDAGLLVVDSDSAGQPITMDQVWQAICAAQPMLASYTCLQTTSSSSNVMLRANTTGVGGIHTFLHVADASDGPRTLEALHVRMCLAGHGRHKLSRSGAFLARSFVDQALKVPSQPIYLKAHVVEPVTQQKVVFLRQSLMEVVDTRVVVPDLTDAERQTYAQHLAEAEAAMKPQMDAQLDRYVTERVGEMITDQGITEDQARAAILDAMSSKLLTADFPIHVADQVVTVGQILADPETWHGVACCDPLQPDFNNARSVAKIYSAQAQPVISSFAHSGGDQARNYRMMPMPSVAPQMHEPQAAPQTSGNFFVDVVQPVIGILHAGLIPDCKRTAADVPRSDQPASPSNMTYVMHCAGATKFFNCMTQDVEWSFGGPVGDVISWSGASVDEVAVPVLKELASRCDIKPTAAETALQDVQAIKYHPMEDWLNGLPAWDGVDRLGAIADNLPSPNPIEYIRAVITKWFIQGVQAACGWRDPKQIPHVLCWSGDQGMGKTRWVMTSAPSQFTTEGVTLSITGDPTKDRDSIRAASRTPIVELGELETTFSKSSNEAQKNYLSRTHDTYRMAYAKREITCPRCSVYAGTLNGSGFLRDETGARRFWPIQITGELPRILEADLEQVWAQAKHLWQGGASWFLDEAEQILHAEVVEHHTEGDTSDDLLEEVFPNGFWSRPHGQYASIEDPYYELLTITEIGKRIGIERPNQKERRLIRHWAEKHGGCIGQYEPHLSRRVEDGSPNVRRKRVFMAVADQPAYQKNKMQPIPMPVWGDGTPDGT